MITHYVIYDSANRVFVRAGKGVGFCYSLNTAKHFSSEWSAKQFLSNIAYPEIYTIKKIVHQ